MVTEKRWEEVAIAHAVNVFHDGEGFNDRKTGDDHTAKGLSVHGAIEEVGKGDEEEDGHFLSEAAPSNARAQVAFFVGSKDAREEVQHHEKGEGLDGGVNAPQHKVQ